MPMSPTTNGMSISTVLSSLVQSAGGGGARGRAAAAVQLMEATKPGRTTEPSVVS